MDIPAFLNEFHRRYPTYQLYVKIIEERGVAPFYEVSLFLIRNNVRQHVCNAGSGDVQTALKLVLEEAGLYK